uniref:Lipocalin/cytosolic fatty-acid binding domain-containing protein n=1 Tax=Clastoptera arizonana TaxID=38151 RepID=A0A1B6D7A7_9HEMI
MISVINQYMRSDDLGKEYKLNGIMKLPNDSTNGMILSLQLNWLTVKTRPYWVLKTDYDNFSIVYSLEKDLWLFPRDMYWIFTRKQEISVDVLAKIIVALNSLNLHFCEFYFTYQRDCY